eukprot:764277-Hanusia_phi.AAC.2
MGNENSAPKKEGRNLIDNPHSDPDILEAIGLGWIAPKEEGQHVSSQGKSSDNRSAGNHSHIQQFHHDVIPGRIPMVKPSKHASCAHFSCRDNLEKSMIADGKAGLVICQASVRTTA